METEMISLWFDRDVVVSSMEVSLVEATPIVGMDAKIASSKICNYTEKTRMPPTSAGETPTPYEIADLRLPIKAFEKQCPPTSDECYEKEAAEPGSQTSIRRRGALAKFELYQKAHSPVLEQNQLKSRHQCSIQQLRREQQLPERQRELLKHFPQSELLKIPAG
ncbi:hypothetical protein OEA41_004802 [Lepraria neglecta]|uniref:Uncharacterized protein n=1 Tax=Lepraria neglecta TaxID=209136 RepID=A0AAE0DGG4_9LECA|nr:hypothetical protein OEA41_004802 [Lepraria neglecta]